MSKLGTLTLRHRTFDISKSEITYYESDDTWAVEIETFGQVFDGECWEPRLYHQGLRLPARTLDELSGCKTAWAKHEDGCYVHPELGLLYVFGHHHVYNCSITFGALSNGFIQMSWSGLCEVFWDDEFSDNVPFTCNCYLFLAVT